MSRLIIHVFRDRSVVVEATEPVECLVVDESGPSSWAGEPPHVAALIPECDMDEAFARFSRDRFNPCAEES